MVSSLDRPGIELKAYPSAMRFLVQAVHHSKDTLYWAAYPARPVPELPVPRLNTC